MEPKKIESYIDRVRSLADDSDEQKVVERGIADAVLKCALDRSKTDPMFIDLEVTLACSVLCLYVQIDRVRAVIDSLYSDYKAQKSAATYREALSSGNYVPIDNSVVRVFMDTYRDSYDVAYSIITD